MKETSILSVEGTIHWDRLPTVSIDYRVKGEPTEATAFAQICRDDQYLYLHLWTCEQEYRAVETGLDGTPCNDSCLEFFFRPDNEDPRYLNFEFNPNRCLHLGVGTGIHDLVRIAFQSEAEINSLFSPEVIRQAAGWSITYRIPYSFIRRYFPNFAPNAGTSIRGNFYKCTHMTVPPHFLSWNPITHTRPGAFHTPGEFGLLCFV